MIKFTQKKNKKVTVAQYSKQLDGIMENWKGVGTVKIFKGVLIIQNISFTYFCEQLINNKISFQVVTEL